MSSWFKPGDTVVFRAYAVDPKSKKVVDPKAVQVLLRHDPERAERQAEVRRDRAGRVDRAAVDGHVDGARRLPDRSRRLQGPDSGQAKRQQEAQGPVRPDAGPRSAAEHLADGTGGVRPSAPAGPAGAGLPAPALAASLYVDTVAGTGPVGGAKRPVGCSQTNVYKRGEQVVVRSWGTDLAPPTSSPRTT